MVVRQYAYYTIFFVKQKNSCVGIKLVWHSQFNIFITEKQSNERIFSQTVPPRRDEIGREVKNVFQSDK